MIAKVIIVLVNYNSLSFMFVVITIAIGGKMKNKLRMNTQYIDFYLQKHQITKHEFAKRCEISKYNLTSVYNQKNIDIFIMLKIVEVLKISCDTFLFKEKYFPKNNYSKSN